MWQARQHGTSRSRAVYGLLLKLYPGRFLQQHEAEMLQNFEDLQQASPSRTALWLYLGKDLAVSLRSQFRKTFWGQTAIVLLVLTVLLLLTGRDAAGRMRPTEGFCSGYILGWFAGWFGERWRSSSISCVPNRIRSFPAQAAVVMSVLVLVIAVAGFVSGTQSHVIWALCYGFLLAWVAGWIGNRRQTRP